MEEEILKILRNKKNTSLTSIEINDFLGLNSVEEYATLEKVLDKLCQEGKIYYSEKNRICQLVFTQKNTVFAL